MAQTPKPCAVSAAASRPYRPECSDAPCTSWTVPRTSPSGSQRRYRRREPSAPCSWWRSPALVVIARPSSRPVSAPAYPDRGGRSSGGPSAGRLSAPLLSVRQGREDLQRALRDDGAAAEPATAADRGLDLTRLMGLAFG